MNVLQTPGFQYCVYFDGLSPALCNFRGLCVWLVSCDCALVAVETRETDALGDPFIHLLVFPAGDVNRYLLRGQ